MNTPTELAIEAPFNCLDVQFSPNAHRNTDLMTGFEGYRAFSMKNGEKLTKGNMQKNHIVFVLKGSAKYSLDGRVGYITANEMLFVPFSQTFSMRCDNETCILLHTFGALNSEISEYLTRMYKMCNVYTGESRQPLAIDGLYREYILYTYNLVRNNQMPQWLMEQKVNESFYLMLQSFPEVKVLAFFRSLICREQYFRNTIMKYCDKVDSIDELIERTGMCRTNFYKQFNREFGMSVHRWMQQRRANSVRETAAQPLMTVKKLMKQHNFSSPSNFIRFCRLYFGCTPNELIRNLRSGLPIPEIAVANA